MRRWFWLVPVAFLLANSGSHSAPLKGARGMPQTHIGGNAKLEVDEQFKGGQRACVIAVGDHKPVVDLTISVYDENKQLVAEDQGGGDFVSAIWYPPRDATYRVVVKNPGVDYNKVYLVFK